MFPPHEILFKKKLVNLSSYCGFEMSSSTHNHSAAIDKVRFQCFKKDFFNEYNNESSQLKMNVYVEFYC